MDAITGILLDTVRTPPVWILALPFLTTGMLAGFVYVTLPQILSIQGVPGGRIAIAVAISTSPSFWNFLLAPLLDVRFRRRTYAIIFALLAVTATAFTVIRHASLVETEVVMLIGVLSLTMFMSATGGWIGSLIEKGQNSRLGAWTTVYNIGGNGVGVLLSGYAMERLSQTAAAAILFVTFLSPLLVFPMIPAPPPGRMLAGESFGRFAREAASLLERREVLVALALLALPSAAFALTNVLGGWSGDFHALPSLVSIIGGVGTILGGVAGSLTVPLLARKFPLRPLYLSIGLIGATFTLSLLLLPRVSATYAFAFVGENVFQSAAIATAFAITFQLIGTDNPLASTIFALLSAAMNCPIDYMEIVDARGYDRHGITGAFLADALVGGGACILLAIVLGRRRLPAQSAERLACSRGK